ncbi:hypothetical protein [Arthrobacter roseus]|uniref:hypothetical protein n=1 Tax=Arthrobacter roseus TaxID=136274 RepID=UPI0019667D97|nr:hypothetical protein [Arthrobacter roseus]MBM7847002.1 hypothetical protein [Arthrobacter roseus]
MGSLRILIVIAAVGLIALVLWLIIRKAMRGTRVQTVTTDGLSEESARATRVAFQAESRVCAIALAAACGGFFAMWTLGSEWSQSYGLPYALAAGVAVLVGLLVFSLHRRPSWPANEHGSTIAELSPRGPTRFGRKWIFVLPAASAAILVVGLLLAGVYSATDEFGLHRVYQYRSLSGWGIENGQVVDVQYNLSSAGPFPGWYYGVPLMICTVLIAAAAYWALRRSAQAARPATPSLFTVDSALRALQTKLIMSFSSAALGIQIGGLGLVTGNALRIAHVDLIPTVDLDAVAERIPVEPGYTLALIMIVSSLVIVTAAMVLAINSVSVVVALWTASRTRGQQVQSELVR